MVDPCSTRGRTYSQPLDLLLTVSFAAMPAGLRVFDLPLCSAEFSCVSITGQVFTNVGIIYKVIPASDRLFHSYAHIPSPLRTSSCYDNDGTVDPSLVLVDQGPWKNLAAIQAQTGWRTGSGWVHLAAEQETLTLHSRYLLILRVFCKQDTRVDRYLRWQARCVRNGPTCHPQLAHTFVSETGLSVRLPQSNPRPRLSATYYRLLRTWYSPTRLYIPPPQSDT